MNAPDNATTMTLRDAATVVVLRDGSAGLEVFLLKRHNLSDAFGGAFVFPGGKVDTTDGSSEATSLLDHGLEDLHARLGEPQLVPAQAGALYFAACRETWEESGVLLAHDGGRALVGELTLAMGQDLSFIEALSRAQVTLNTTGLVPWKRWITPKLPSVGSKRFDTRFFLAAMPVGQDATHDDHETTHSQWMTPKAALQSYTLGEIELAPPQVISLAELAQFTDVAQALNAATGKHPPCIEPESFTLDDERYICFPGDPRHSRPEVACEGPLRMVWRNRRFVPPEGPQSFFA